MTNSGLRYFIVDAFTNRPFAGNPAAVVPLTSWRDEAWLQDVAMEMNLAETAFIVPNETGYDLRWFTPKVEVELCGHATLAAAKILAHLDKLPDGAHVEFSSLSGVLKASRNGEQFILDFPIKPEVPCEPPAGLIESLNVKALYVGRSEYDYLVQVESESVLRSIRPDFLQLGAVDCRGVIVTARSEVPPFDFVSRFFAPAVGINEDPVTGSAHCCLADFWRKHLGKSTMLGYQASARGGRVKVDIHADRVHLGGQAVIMAQGELLAS